jgi:hypothetical protein
MCMQYSACVDTKLYHVSATWRLAGKHGVDIACCQHYTRVRKFVLYGSRDRMGAWRAGRTYAFLPCSHL